jgi:light-harvesting protein B-800-850 alpha chain
MNYGRIWLVVKPSIGVPLMLVACATASLIVHASILTHTTWFPAFLEGKSKAVMASTASAPATINVAPQASSTSPNVVINVAPK